MTVPAPGRAPAHPPARRAAPRRELLGFPPRTRPVLGSSPSGSSCTPPLQQLSRRGPGLQPAPLPGASAPAKPPRCGAGLGGAVTVSRDLRSARQPGGSGIIPCASWLASWRAAQTPRAGFSDRASRPPLRLRNENMPRWSPRAELEAVLGPDLAVAPIPSHPIRRSWGSQGPLHMLSCMLLLLRMQKEKEKSRRSQDPECRDALPA